MPPFFHTPQRITTLETEAQSWLGTPFRNNSAVRGPGGGVSCHRLASELYFATGALDRFEVPKSSASLLANGPDKALLDYLDTQLAPHFTALDPAHHTPLPGDLIIMREHRVLKHLGIVLPSARFIHVFPRLGVLISLLADSTYGNRIEAIRRPINYHSL
jgi:cell wall-associated NlpC family hydrolase